MLFPAHNRLIPTFVSVVGFSTEVQRSNVSNESSSGERKEEEEEDVLACSFNCRGRLQKTNFWRGWGLLTRLRGEKTEFCGPKTSPPVGTLRHSLPVRISNLFLVTSTG